MPKLSEKRKELLTAMMKEAIYNASIAVVREHGVGGMTMDRVATAANLAKGSLYNYFHDKQDLLRFVYGKIFAPINQVIAETAAASMPAPQKLEAILSTLFNHFGQHCGVISLLLADERARVIVEPTKQTGRAASLRHFVTIFSQGIAEGSFRPMDPEIAGWMLLGSISEIFQQQLRGQHRSAEEIIAGILGIFLQGVSAESTIQAS